MSNAAVPELVRRDAEVPAIDDRTWTAWTSLRRFAPHLLALVFPLNTLVFVLTGPHDHRFAFSFLLPIVGCVLLDAHGGEETRPPAARIPSLPFDALLGLLAALQLVNVFLAARMIQQTGTVVSLDTVLVAVVVGSSSAYSGIVVAHELIHRRQRAWRNLGRLLLATVLYEHFSVEHVRGHHVRVGTLEDPATARFGESFNRFYFRTVPAQFRSAWRLEAERLGDVNMPWYDPRTIRNRVLHGVAVELGIAAGLYAAFGPAALVAHVGQALWASRSLEVVNYFEHWGIVRRGRRVMPVHSWDSYSRFTYYALTGLSRHADHHAFASRPYEQLRVWQASPKLPTGYLAMFYLVLLRNRRFQKLMTAELLHRKLGPFASDANETAQA